MDDVQERLKKLGATARIGMLPNLPSAPPTVKEIDLS